MPEEPMKEAPKAAAGTSENKLLAALCYIINVIVPLFVIFTEKKKDRFLAFHAWQALLFAVAIFIVSIVLSIVITVLGFIPGINVVAGLLAACGFPLLWLAVMIYVLFLAYKAYQGEKVMVPMVGEYAEKQLK